MHRSLHAFNSQLRHISARAIAALCLSLPLSTPSLCAAALKPQDFAYGMPIVAASPASAYRLTLVPDVYRGMWRADLGDLRVFNAKGETVAHVLIRRRLPTAGPEQAMPLFPLRGDARAATNALRLTVREGGVQSLAADPNAASPTVGPVEQYILDGEALTLPVISLLLSWPEHSADFSGQMRLEVSDDLINWRTVVNAASIANLHTYGQTLIENRLDVPNVLSKFWRLTWVGVKPSFELNAVKATMAAGPLPSNLSTSTEFIKGTADASGQFEFDAGANLPVERVNLALPEANSMYMVELSSRSGEQDAWEPVTRSGFYRLATASGEQRNNPVSIGLRRDRYFRARFLGGGTRPDSLRLELMWSPADLEFLAQGPPPYLLAFGSSSVPPAEVDIKSIPAGVDIGSATFGPRGSLGGESRLVSTATTRRSVLWAVLIIVVLVVTSMLLRRSPVPPRNAPR